MDLKLSSAMLKEFIRIIFIVQIMCGSQVGSIVFIQERHPIQPIPWSVTWLQKSRSVTECAILCLIDSKCLVFSYNTTNMACVGHTNCKIGDNPEISEVFYRPKDNVYVNPCKSCPAPYNCNMCGPVNLCYKLQSQDRHSQSFYSKVCASDGGRLLRIDSSEKQQVVEQIIDATNETSEMDIWIQGNLINGQWIFTDNTPMIYSKWASGEGIHPDAPLVFIRKQENNRWRDAPSTWLLPYALCEIVK